MAGYYWGKKSILEPFAAQLESESLSDKISYAFCSLYEMHYVQTCDTKDERLETQQQLVQLERAS